MPIPQFLKIIVYGLISHFCSIMFHHTFLISVGDMVDLKVMRQIEQEHREVSCFVGGTRLFQREAHLYIFFKKVETSWFQVWELGLMKDLWYFSQNSGLIQNLMLKRFHFQNTIQSQLDVCFVVLFLQKLLNHAHHVQRCRLLGRIRAKLTILAALDVCTQWELYMDCILHLLFLYTTHAVYPVCFIWKKSSSFGDTAKRQMSIIETNSDNLARSSQQGLKHRRINGKGDVPRKKDKMHNFEEYECAAATKRAIRFRGRCLCILFRFQVDTWEEAVAVLEAIGRVPSSLSPSASCLLQSCA